MGEFTYIMFRYQQLLDSFYLDFDITSVALGLLKIEKNLGKTVM